ncbi:MAG: glycosyltransferase family 2 protein [Candidatus Woesebacteria bacterium]|jgi:glycosyltransferase involved in cell wall biosynthesis
MISFHIVTPSFNQAEFIQETIDSVLKQKGKFKINYWVIDSESTDKTVKILKKHGSKINWLSEKDKGQTDAINKGIKKILASKTDLKNSIFAYINSDDYYLPQAFEKVARAFEKNPKKMWLTGEYQVSSTKKQLGHELIRRVWKGFFKKIYCLPLLLILNPLAQPTTFIRLQAIKEIGPFKQKLKYTMDYEYWLRLEKKYGKPIFINEKLAIFRIHQSSKGGSQYKKQFQEQFAVAKRYTKNPILLFLHQLHNLLTLTIYKVLK